MHTGRVPFVDAAGERPHDGVTELLCRHLGAREPHDDEVLRRRHCLLCAWHSAGLSRRSILLSERSCAARLGRVAEACLG